MQPIEENPVLLADIAKDGHHVTTTHLQGGLPAKLLDAALDVESVAKRGKNTHQNYSYATSEDVATAATTALLKHRVFSDFEAVSCELREVKTAKGAPAVLSTVHGRLTVTDADSGESISRHAIGCGHDSPGDKAVLKAMTSARKYAFLHLLGIPIGIDPEDDHGYGPSRRQTMPPANPLSDERVEALRQLLKARKADGFTLPDLDLVLGACGIDALRARSAKAITERFASLDDEQADKLEAAIKGWEAK